LAQGFLGSAFTPTETTGRELSLMKKGPEPKRQANLFYGNEEKQAKKMARKML